MAFTIPDDYYKRISTAESGGNRYAKNRLSSASGLYQFTKDTFTGLGYNWADRFNATVQNEAVRKLTQSNASILNKAGIEINYTNLYAAHFFGGQGAVDVLSNSDDTPLSGILSSKVLAANPTLKGKTVGDLKADLNKKVGNQNIVGGGIVQSVKDAATGAFESAKSAANAPSSILEFFKEFFSYRTAGRFASVFVGIILVGLAVAAFAFSSDVQAAVKKGITP